jgi:hypothetical protein
VECVNMCNSDQTLHSQVTYYRTYSNMFESRHGLVSKDNIDVQTLTTAFHPEAEPTKFGLPFD